MEVRRSISSNTEFSETLSINQPLLVVGANTVITNTSSNCNFFFVTIEPILFILMAAYSFTQPLTINLIIKRTCEVHFQFNESLCSSLNKNNTNESHLEIMVQPYADTILMAMQFLSVFFSSILSILFGAWSDRHGRKLLLIIPAIGYIISYLLFGIFSVMPNLQPAFFLLAILPVSLTGDLICFVPAAYSYVCDSSNEDNRSFKISILESIMFCGSLLGNIISSQFYNAVGNYTFLLVYGLCSVIIFLGTLYTYYLVPESLTTTENEKRISKIFDVNSIKKVFEVCFKKRENNGRAIIFLVITALTSTICIMIGEGNVKFLFTRIKFNWNMKDYTEWVSATLIANFFGVFIGSFILIKYFKISDTILAIISYVMQAAGDLYIAFIPSNSSSMMFYVGILKLFTGFCGPAGRAILSKTISAEDLGKVFAFVSMCEAVFPLAFVPIYTFLYNFTLNSLPNSFIFFSASLYILDIILYIIIIPLQRSSRNLNYEITNNENNIK